MATVVSIEELLNVIDDVQSFNVTDGLLIERRSRGKHQEPVKLVIKELAAIDSRIPQALLALARISKDRSGHALGDILYTSVLKDTLRFWLQPRWLYRDCMQMHQSTWPS